MKVMRWGRIGKLEKNCAEDKAAKMKELHGCMRIKRVWRRNRIRNR